MKTCKILAAIMLVAASVLYAGAQSNYGEFKWGLTGGMAFANMNQLGDFEKDKGKLGLVAGAFMKIPLSHKASIRPELLFNMKGATLKETVQGQENKGRYSLNYVEVPISLDFEFMGIFDLHAGVQGAYLLSNSFKLNGEKIDLVDDVLKKTEFGFHFGTGIDLGNIGMHVRFQQSLTSFLDKNKTADFDPRNWGITLTGAYMFIN